MAVIYMVHPQHGAKVAIAEEEAIYDEMHGWTRYNPDTPSVTADADEVDEPVNAMAEPKRRGRRRAAQEG